MQLFSKHVSQGVAEAIWEERDKFMDHGRPRPKKLVATVLFTDLKDFASVSERLDPRTLMDWLNEYMDAMARIIMRHDGTINKYIGDSVMAVFGVPLARETDSGIGADARNAVICALEMGAEVERLNGLWANRNLPVAYMRIGISTGPLVAGCLGGSERMEYTVIGDTVNTASRLEGFGKERDPIMPDARPWRILIGEATLKYLDDQFETTSVGTVALKGKKLKTGVHLVISHTGEATSPLV
jgi:adenylate cyclase